MPRPNVPAPAFDATPQEPLVAIAVRPPSPPFSGKWADSTVIYNGENILAYDTVKADLMADLNARQAALHERRAAAAQAHDQASIAGDPAAQEAAQSDLAACAAEQRALDRESYEIAARWLVWRVTDAPDGKGTTWLGGPDQIGWATAPLPLLMWMTLKGQMAALEELTGPLPRS